MLTQTFAIGTVLVKVAHVPKAAWANWFTSVVLVVMICATVGSGLLATRRPSWQRLRVEGKAHGHAADSA